MTLRRLSGSTIVFVLALAISLAAHAVVGTRAYYQFGFSSDGFHYYSAIRNSLGGQSAWEGPVFEYLLGNHAYLTLFGLAPLVKVFASPLVLFYAGLVSWHLSALGVFFVARVLAKQFEVAGSGTPAALGLAYLAYPLVVEGSSGFDIFLFQPDSFLAPGLALMTYAYLNRQRILFLLAMVFVLWTKEEYLPLVPVVAAWLMATAWYLFGKERFGWKNWAVAAVVYLAAAAFSVATLLYFRSQNLSIHVPSSLSVSALLHPGSYAYMAFFLALLILPALPFLCAWLRVVKRDGVPEPAQRKTLAYVFGTVLVFVGGRLIGDMIIYGAVPGMHGLQAWSHAVVAPMLFLTLAVVFAPGVQRGESRHAVGLTWPVLASAVLSAAVIWLWMSGRLDQYRAQPVPRLWKVFPDQLAEIRQRVPPAARYEVILLPEFHLYPFMDRSHVAYEWWCGRPAPQKEAVAQQVLYAVLPKAPSTREDLQLLLRTHRVVFATKDYLLLKRNWQ